MRFISIFFSSLFCILLILQIDFVYSQFEDDEFEIEPMEKCLPESLTTKYESFANLKVENIEIRRWYSFGSEYYKQYNYTEALPYFWKVFLNDTTKYASNAIGEIADSYFKLKYADSALIACYRGLEVFPELTMLHYYAGYLQDNKGKFRCAIPHYEKLVEQNPDEKSYLEKLAFLYFKDENEKAIEIQQRLIDLEPDNPEYLEIQATYMDYFNYDPLEPLRQAHENDPQNKNISFRLGKAEFNAGNYSKAVSVLTDLVKIDSANSEAYKLCAKSKECLEDYYSAISDYKSILKIQPDNADIMCSIAVDYKFLYKFKEGSYWIKKALRAKPNYGLAHITMAEIYEYAVPYCQKLEKRTRKLDDGLVYEKAYKEYEKAQRDPHFASISQKRKKQLKPLLPTREEIFFAGEKKIKSPCYKSWIKD
ncbi:MAG: hypothetical protein K8R79_02945 [Calditrichales bacterium]|nr:hypothetical protein [Calditrichales bacterium]